MILQGKRVFIVEDNLENRIVAQMLLTEHGASVAFERWGRGTTDKLKAFAPVDIILLDLMLPGNVTGYDVFDQIRQLPEFNHVPIVAVSAADSSSAIPKAQAKGFAGFIPKPIGFSTFAHYIADLINGKQLWLNR